MKLKPLFLLPVLLCLVTTKSIAQNPIKKITITVTDAVSGKPVENADVSFKGLIFRL